MRTRKHRGLEPDGPRTEKPCSICGKPMLVATGQIAKYHKKCRKLRHNKNAYNN